jgi:hypothetical protein
MHTIQIQKTIPVTNGGDTTTVKTNYCGHLTYTIGYAPINVKPQRGGGIYGGFDRSLSPHPREFDPYFRPEGGDI